MEPSKPSSSRGCERNYASNSDHDPRSSRDAASSSDWGAPPDASDDPVTDKLHFNPAYVGDRHFYRVVVWTLAGAALVALLGTIGLVANDKAVPDSIVAIGSTAVGALAGLVAGNRM